MLKDAQRYRVTGSRVMLCCGMCCYAMLCCVVLCYAMSRVVMLCCAMLCHAMLCYAVSCCVMFCYLVLKLNVSKPGVWPCVTSWRCVSEEFAWCRPHSTLKSCTFETHDAMFRSLLICMASFWCLLLGLSGCSIGLL